MTTPSKSTKQKTNGCDRDAAQAEVRTFTANVARARLDLGYATLKAPFDGTIVATYVEAYEYVRAQQPIVRLLDTSRIEMVIDVPEGDASTEQEMMVWDQVAKRALPLRPGTFLLEWETTDGESVISKVTSGFGGGRSMLWTCDRTRSPGRLSEPSACSPPGSGSPAQTSQIGKPRWLCQCRWDHQ